MLKPYARGLTLIELMVGLALIAMLVTLGAPAFGTWMANARIRSTAEATLAGLQLARSEATTRNAQVRFQLTSSLGADCVLSEGGPNWILDVVTTDNDDSVIAHCNLAASDTIAPHILHKRAAADSLGSTHLDSNIDTLIFNGLGRLTNSPAGGVSIEIYGANSNSCLPTGELNCLRIQVSVAGQIRMCNPVFANGTAQACQ